MTKPAISLALVGGAIGVTALTSAAFLVACNAKQSAAPQIIQLAAPADAVKPPTPGGMSVTGSAVLDVAPDTADLTMTLTAQAQHADAAATAVDKKEEALVANLAKIGIDQGDIKLSYVTLAQHYTQATINTPAYPNGYDAAVTITATTKAFAKIGAMMEAGTSAGATSLSTSFRRSDISDLKKKVREMALSAAKAKAAQTASALDIQLGRVLAVSESGGGIYNENVYQRYQVANVANLAGVAGDAGGNAVSLGAQLQPLTIDITVSYELAK